jgi:hypothetical protein
MICGPMGSGRIVATHDRGFARFEGLRGELPLGAWRTQSLVS